LSIGYLVFWKKLVKDQYIEIKNNARFGELVLPPQT